MIGLIVETVVSSSTWFGPTRLHLSLCNAGHAIYRGSYLREVQIEPCIFHRSLAAITAAWDERSAPVASSRSFLLTAL